MCDQPKLVWLLFVVFFLVGLVYGQDVNNTMDSSDDANVTDARTFGHHFLKRISFAIIPAAFVVGVITTLLAALTVVSMKGLGVGIVLLVIALGQMLGRAFPIAAPLQAAPYQAPIPIVYSQRQDPVWLDKTWRR